MIIRHQRAPPRPRSPSYLAGRTLISSEVGRRPVLLRNGPLGAGRPSQHHVNHVGSNRRNNLSPCAQQNR
jgi:hypothetical protein